MMDSSITCFSQWIRYFLINSATVKAEFSCTGNYALKRQSNPHSQFPQFRHHALFLRPRFY
jgi:hypothetical protein